MVCMFFNKDWCVLFDDECCEESCHYKNDEWNSRCECYGGE